MTTKNINATKRNFSARMGGATLAISGESTLLNHGGFVAHRAN